MKDHVTTSLVQADRLNQLQQCIFDTLDVSDTTRQDYASRIKYFIRYLGDSELNCRTFLEYKRFLGQIDTYSISTKNKYRYNESLLEITNLTVKIQKLAQHII